MNLTKETWPADMNPMENMTVIIKEEEDIEWDAIQLEEESLSIKDEDYEVESVIIKEEPEEMPFSIDMEKHEVIYSVNEGDLHSESVRVELPAQAFNKRLRARSKEIPVEIRKQVVATYQSGKGYKATSKALGLHRTTVRAIISKWKKLGTVVNLPRSGRPSKISTSVQHKFIQEVTNSKELQPSLASAKDNVHDSIINNRQDKSGLH
ncbi:uncharacterized protein LOC114664897 [Erpetoichthys calabaricus]|uniref:uncharacterized protein LOC114664897 n=1 Tax=Erpetoichthys calabaricus TaxID=27687 RepID=UPI00109F21F7|nr:uncharacterized protein LOC114664897 [Erpetoichthys calabaricus]XP_051783477.1 uncharacterized protein LOC114664897 [Erpetoichthys calabaricus]